MSGRLDDSNPDNEKKRLVEESEDDSNWIGGIDGDEIANDDDPFLEEYDTDAEEDLWADNDAEPEDGLVGKTGIDKEIGEDTVGIPVGRHNQSDGSVVLKFPGGGTMQGFPNDGPADMKTIYGMHTPFAALPPVHEEDPRLIAKTIPQQQAYQPETPTQERPAFEPPATDNPTHDDNNRVTDVHDPKKVTNILTTPKTLEDAYEEILSEKKDYKAGETMRFDTSITRGIKSRHQVQTSVALTPEESELAKQVEETIAISEPARIEEPKHVPSPYKLTPREKTRARNLLTEFLDERQSSLNKILTNRIRTYGFGDERDTTINLESLINNPNRIDATALKTDTDEKFINYARGNIELRTDAGKNAMRKYIESAIERNDPEQLTARLAYVGYAAYSRRIDDLAKEVTKDKWTGTGTGLLFLNEMSFHPSIPHKLKDAKKAGEEKRSFFRDFIKELRELDLTTKDGTEQAYGLYKRRALTIRDSTATKTGLLTGQVNLVAYIMHERRAQMRTAGINVAVDPPQNNGKKSQPTIDTPINPEKMAEAEARALAAQPRRARPLAIAGLISAISVAGLAWGFQDNLKPLYNRVGSALYTVFSSKDSIPAIATTPVKTESVAPVQTQKEDPRIKELTAALDEERVRSEVLYQQFTDDLNIALTATENQEENLNQLRETLFKAVEDMRNDMRNDMNQRLEEIYQRVETFDVPTPEQTDAIVIPVRYEERVTQLEGRVKHAAHTIDIALERLKEFQQTYTEHVENTTMRLDSIEDRETIQPQLKELRVHIEDTYKRLENSIANISQDIEMLKIDQEEYTNQTVDTALDSALDTALGRLKEFRQTYTEHVEKTTARLDGIDKELIVQSQLKEPRIHIQNAYEKLENSIASLTRDVETLKSQQKKYVVPAQIAPKNEQIELKYTEPTLSTPSKISSQETKQHTLHPDSFDPAVLYNPSTQYTALTTKRINTLLEKSPLEVSLTIPGILAGLSETDQVKQQVAEVVLYTAYHESHNKNGANQAIRDGVMSAIEEKRSAAEFYLSKREMTILNEHVAAIVRGNFAAYKTKITK